MSMSKEFVIDTKGEAEIFLPAERAVLSIQVHAQGHDKKVTTDNVVKAAREVGKCLREQAASKSEQKAPFDYWSRTSLSEDSHVPWDNDRKVHLPREYQTTVNFSIRFEEFNALGRTIYTLVAIDHVRSDGVQWTLTHDTMEAQRSKLRTMAAKDALSRAQSYANALGYDKVTPVEMKERQAHTRVPSGHGTTTRPSDGIETQSKNLADEEEWQDLGEETSHYIPEEVKMTQSVDAKFRAE